MRLRQTSLLAVLFFFLTGLVYAAPPAITPTGRSVPGEVLVKFAPGASDDDVASAGHGADVDHSQRLSALKSGTIWRLHSRSLKTDALAAALLHNPKVVYAEPNYLVSIGSSPNDTSYSQLWGLNNTGQTIGGTFGLAGADIHAEAAWTVTTGSASIVVGVVDTGIDYTHPDLAANVWSNPGGKGNALCAAGTHGFNAVTGSCDPMDDHYHGTHVSGTIGAVGNNSLGVVGVNWTTSIMGLKFLDSSGYGSTGNAIAAIDFAVQAKIDGVNVRVLSNSWGGGPFSKALLDEINKAGENDILFVASAGNDSLNNDLYPHYPANYGTPNLISVAATDNQDKLAYFSDYGVTTVHLGAPGMSVLSCMPGSGYQILSGTSMAAPHVSGVAALVLANSPSLTTAQVKSAILDHVDPIPSLQGLTVTGGRLDAARALGATVPPAFTLSVSPASRTAARGGSTTFTVNVVPSDGFSGSVDLSVSNLPSGVTGSFAPTTTSTSSILTLNVDPAANLGTFQIVITGTSGALTRMTPASLSVSLVTPPIPCGAISLGYLYLSFDPYGLASGDLDRDGISDFVAVSPSNRIMIAMGSGTGGFRSVSYLPASNTPLGVTLADFNRDGKLDMAIVGAASSSVTIRLGNGDGTFAAPIDYAASSSPFWVTAGDFNGDGKTDLAVANNGAANISILIGQGDGTFAAPVNYAVGSGPYWVSAADLNGDGKLDLAVADYNVNKVSILIGQGDGTFAAAVHYSVGNGPSSIAISDFNRDGKPDLAVSNYASNNVSILLGAGNGTFGAAVQYATNAGPSSVVALDINGDNQLDLAVANTDSGTISILRGAGDGTFSAQTPAYAGGTVNQIALADLDRDGRVDLVISNSSNDELVTYRVTGVCAMNCGAMSAAAGATSGSAPQSIAAADFNGDAKTDFAVANSGSGTVSVAIGNGDGTFQSSTDYVAGSAPQSVSTGDLNGDGKPDLIVADSSANHVNVLLGNTGGTFQGAVVYGAGTTPDSVVAGDFNGDGKLDVAAANGGSDNVSVLLGNGNGTLQTAVNYGAGTSPKFVVTGDFNRDGKLDLAVANSGSNNVSLLLGNGDGTFQTALAFSAGTTPVALVAGDFNRDGRLDLAVANSGSNNISILLGSSTGNFLTAVNYSIGGTSPRGVIPGDFNNDGIPDLAVAVNGSNQAAILFGLGNGTFGAPVSFATGTSPVALAVADFNRDGHADLAAVNNGTNNVSVLLNTCPLADLTTTVVHNGAFSQGDTGKTYTITATNSGAAATAGSVTVVAATPLSLIPTGMSGSGWTCTLNNLTCTRSDALAGGSSYPAVTLTVNVASTAPASLTANVTVAGGGEVNTNNDTAADTVSVAAITDLTIALTHTGSFTQGAAGKTYTMSVRNAGRAATSGQITVTDALPAGLTATALSGTGWSCNLGALTCTRSDSLAAASGAPVITLTVNVSASAPASVVNVATVSGGGESLTGNDTAQDPTTIWAHQTCGGFTAASGYPAGTYPYAMAKGDFNHDGKVDIAVTNGGSAGVSVLLASAGGTFLAPVTYTVPYNPNILALTDLDGDGNADILVGNNSSSNLYVLMGKSDGTFGTATAYPAGSFTSTGLTIADFNGDANPDVAVSSSQGYIYILLGNGNGTLQAPVALNASGFLVAVTSADLDGDGKVDLITADANYLTNNVLVLKGNGDGTFQTPAAYPAGYSINALSLADLNNDGKLDIVVGRNYANTVTVLLGNGDGTFVKSGDYVVNGINNFTVDDINGDGNPDIVSLANYGYISILLGKGDGTFQDALSIYTYTYGSGSVVVGDFNSDGNADLLISDGYYTGQLWLMKGGCPDLTITKTHYGSFTAGTSNSYTVTVTNIGASTVSPITVKDLLPAGLSITNMYAYPGTCDVASATCTNTSVLRAGQSYTVQVYVDVSKTAPSQLVNQATVSGGGDVNLQNNTAADPTNVVYLPNLTVTKTHNGSFVVGDTGRTYTITVANSGSAPTTGTVNAVDQLPSGLTATAISGQGWNCSLASVSCSRSDALQVNAAYPPITVTVNVGIGLTGGVTNVAFVSGGGETNTGDDAWYDPTVVLSKPNNVVATAVLSNQINVTWDWVSGASAFQILRSTDNNSFAVIATATQSNFLDTSLEVNKAYFYRVRAIDATATGPASASDVALTFLFSNDPIVPTVTPVRATDVTELRTAVNILRTAAGLAPATFTDTSLAGQPIKPVHFTQVQSALDQARTALNLPPISFTSLPASGAPIYGLYVRLLRSGLK